MDRMASAMRESPSPRSIPGGASPPDVARSASTSNTSIIRASTSSRPGNTLADSSLTSFTSVESRSTPRT